MSDIVERLRAWVYTDSQYATAREAADEIERLRDLRDDDGEVMSALIDGYQRILRLLIDGPESMATDIVSDAREWLDGYAGRESTHSAKCHGWHDACLIARLVAECERLRGYRDAADRLTVTDAEREAVEWYAAYGAGDHAATLRSLLSRTGSDSAKTADNAAE
jgi:hypothetical protein